MRGVMGFRINRDCSQTWNATEYYNNWEPLLLGDKWNEVDIMQYTGLKDKNGKEIYEGDIIEQKFINDDECMVFIVKDIRELNNIYIGSSKENIIIGNIHENPELIGANNDS